MKNKAIIDILKGPAERIREQERDKAKKLLEMSELRYRRLFEAARDGILILDVDTGRIMDVNPYLIELTGFSEKEFLDKRIWEIGPFRDIEAAKDSFLKLQTVGYVRYENLPLKTKDGRVIDVEFISNIYNVGSRNVIQCNIRNISARISNQREMEFKNLILTTQLETALDGILVVDTAGRAISSNSRFYHMWGLPPGLKESDSEDSVLKTAMGKLKDPDEFGERVKFLYANPAEKSDEEIELKDGRFFECYSAAMLDSEGKNFGRVWYFRDITARKNAELVRLDLEAQLRGHQKMEAIGGLAGGIAHDFNNLLSVILGYTGFVMNKVEVNDPLRKDMLEIKHAAERAVNLTRQLLAFSRKLILQPVPVNLNDSVIGLEKMLKHIIGEDIEMGLKLEPNLGRVLADPGQIEQVIVNLVVNARDAMPTGGRLTIETQNVVINDGYALNHVSVLPGSYVRLSVADTGCGMDEKTKSRIFEPFFTTKSGSQGTGLGLSTAYGIIKQSNGNIWVYSELGHGTVFKIYLPLMEAVVTTGATDTAASAGYNTGNETILVVEDEDALRDIVRIILSAAGYSVLAASGGDEALRMSLQHEGNIRLLLTDVVMPGMSGRVLSQDILKTRPGIKIVYMSGYTDDTIAHHGVLDLGTQFLSKPFSANNLLKKISEVLTAGETG